MSTSEPPYRFEDAQGYSVIVVQPRLNDSQWSEFENVGNELLGRLHQAKTPAFLVDLSGLNYMGSAMVALIVRLWKGVKERNGRMIVINRHPMVFEVMKLAGLHNVWTIVDSREQALKHLGKKGEGGDGAGLLLGLGGLGVAAGLVGLGLLFKYIPLDLSNRAAMACTAVGAVIGLSAGAVCAAKRTGGQQKVGILFAVVSGVILVVAFVNMPAGQASPSAPAPGGAPAPSDESPSEPDAQPQAQTGDTPSTSAKPRGRIKEDDEAGAGADDEPASDPGDEKEGDSPAADEDQTSADKSQSEGPSSKGLGGIGKLLKKNKD